MGTEKNNFCQKGPCNDDHQQLTTGTTGSDGGVFLGLERKAKLPDGRLQRAIGPGQAGFPRARRGIPKRAKRRAKARLGPPEAMYQDNPGIIKKGLTSRRMFDRLEPIS
jgi:hypothetical protein